MTSNICRFTNVEDLAKFCAALTREGIAFHVRPTTEGYDVEITGY